MSELRLKRLLHVSVLTADLARSLQFYHGVLGLEIIKERPELGYPGAWLRLDNGEIHLLQLDNPDPVHGRPDHGGRDRHFALSVGEFQALKAKLNDHSVRYTESKSGRLALFVRDPDGNAVELVGE